MSWPVSYYHDTRPNAVARGAGRVSDYCLSAAAHATGLYARLVADATGAVRAPAKASSTIDQDERRRSLHEVLTEIEGYAALEDDWDGEGSLVPTPAAAQVAKRVVRLVARRTAETGLSWRRPSVEPIGDGRIGLRWEGRGGSVLLLVGPSPQNGCTCVTRAPGAAPRRAIETTGDAVGEVIGVLEGDSAGQP
jgi:hypothetical protein